MRCYMWDLVLRFENAFTCSAGLKVGTERRPRLCDPEVVRVDLFLELTVASSSKETPHESSNRGHLSLAAASA